MICRQPEADQKGGRGAGAHRPRQDFFFMTPATTTTTTTTTATTTTKTTTTKTTNIMISKCYTSKML